MVIHPGMMVRVPGVVSTPGINGKIYKQPHAKGFGELTPYCGHTTCREITDDQGNLTDYEILLPVDPHEDSPGDQKQFYIFTIPVDSDRSPEWTETIELGSADEWGGTYYGLVMIPGKDEDDVFWRSEPVFPEDSDSPSGIMWRKYKRSTLEVLSDEIPSEVIDGNVNKFWDIWDSSRPFRYIYRVDADRWLIACDYNGDPRFFLFDRSEESWTEPPDFINRFFGEYSATKYWGNIDDAWFFRQDGGAYDQWWITGESFDNLNSEEISDWPEYEVSEVLTDYYGSNDTLVLPNASKSDFEVGGTVRWFADEEYRGVKLIVDLNYNDDNDLEMEVEGEVGNNTEKVQKHGSIRVDNEVSSHGGGVKLKNGNWMFFYFTAGGSDYYYESYLVEVNVSNPGAPEKVAEYYINELVDLDEYDGGLRVWHLAPVYDENGDLQEGVLIQVQADYEDHSKIPRTKGFRITGDNYLNVDWEIERGPGFVYGHLYDNNEYWLHMGKSGSSNLYESFCRLDALTGDYDELMDGEGQAMVMTPAYIFTYTAKRVFIYDRETLDIALQVDWLGSD